MSSPLTFYPSSEHLQISHQPDKPGTNPIFKRIVFKTGNFQAGITFVNNMDSPTHMKLGNCWNSRKFTIPIDRGLVLRPSCGPSYGKHIKDLYFHQQEHLACNMSKSLNSKQTTFRVKDFLSPFVFWTAPCHVQKPTMAWTMRLWISLTDSANFETTQRNVQRKRKTGTTKKHLKRQIE